MKGFWKACTHTSIYFSCHPEQCVYWRITYLTTRITWDHVCFRLLHYTVLFFSTRWACLKAFPVKFMQTCTLRSTLFVHIHIIELMTDTLSQTEKQWETLSHMLHCCWCRFSCPTQQSIIYKKHNFWLACPSSNRLKLYIFFVVTWQVQWFLGPLLWCVSTIKARSTVSPVSPGC